MDTSCLLSFSNVTMFTVAKSWQQNQPDTGTAMFCPEKPVLVFVFKEQFTPVQRGLWSAQPCTGTCDSDQQQHKLQLKVFSLKNPDFNKSGVTWGDWRIWRCLIGSSWCLVRPILQFQIHLSWRLFERINIQYMGTLTKKNENLPSIFNCIFMHCEQITYCSVAVLYLHPTVKNLLALNPIVSSSVGCLHCL